MCQQLLFETKKKNIFCVFNGKIIKNGVPPYNSELLNYLLNVTQENLSVNN